MRPQTCPPPQSPSAGALPSLLALGAAAKQVAAEREAALLPMPYHHVFTLPARSPTSPQNKTVAYDLLFKAAADTCGRMAKLSY